MAAVGAVVAAGALVVSGGSAGAAVPPTVALRLLLIGAGASDPTTAAWQSALTGQGVPYTEVTAAGAAPTQSVALPALTTGSTGDYNAVVIADSPTTFAPGALTALDAYESAYGVRQLDGYMFPSPALGVSYAATPALAGSTGTLTAAGRAAFPELAGPVPFDAGSYGYDATADPGAPVAPLLTDPAGRIVASIYQHPGTDPQAGVSELSLYADYNPSMLQWLLLSGGLIDWVTEDTHLGLYRNYFGQDVDDVFIADNEWSRQYQCTPGATQPADYTCPAGVANNPADTPPDVQLTPADVAHVVAWEKTSGITLSLAFNAVGACTAPSVAAESGANCTGSVTEGGATYTDPGKVVNAAMPDDGALVDTLLADQGDFTWITHTWSHLFLGCTVWAAQPLTSVLPSASGGSLAAGGYHYEVTAATGYGESEPSAAAPVSVGAAGSVTLTWPEAGNGVGSDATTRGPSLASEQATHTGGTGFWGYDVYRQGPGTTAFGLVGRVGENPAASSSTTYTFTDRGATAPGAAPGSGPDFPTATNPGIDCSNAAGSWLPATSTRPDSSIDQEIGLDQAFAAANGLTGYSPATVITGEHSGVENPNMPAALADVGVTTFAQDASRQPTQYSLGAALGAPRYPSNIYYNAANWPDELSEYNTLYTAPGVPIGDPSYPGATGRCAATGVTTCLSTPATQASLLASESHIMLGHLLANDPRVGYAHQPNLMSHLTGGVQDGYTLLTLIDDVAAQYHSWYSAAAPIAPVTDTSEARILAERAAWTSAQAAGRITATATDGVVTIANPGPAVAVPITVPAGTTVNGAPFGQPYGGQLSDWASVGAGSLVLIEHVAPSILSAAAATSIVGAPFSFTVTTAGAPAAALTATGALPTGVSFTDNGNGTATIAGTPGAGTGAVYPLTVTAANPLGSVSQAFTLTNAQAPAITSPAGATFFVGTPGTFTVTTTGYPAPTLTATGALPTGVSFTAHPDGTATIAGSPAAGSAPSYPLTIRASNSSGSTATLAFTLTVSATAAPVITSPATAYFTLAAPGAVAVTTTGAPAPAITETPAPPAGLTFTANPNGTALIAGTATVTGTFPLAVTAANGIAPNATQTLTVIVGQAPAFTSPASATATLAAPFSLTVTTRGYPVPAIGGSGLPAGLALKDNGDGTATISGTPTAAGSSPVLLTTVPNAYGTAQQTLTILVRQRPAITSAATSSFTVGAAGAFTVTTTGYPSPALTLLGALPTGVTFRDNGNGTATLAGTPAAGSATGYPVTVTAANGVAPTATQSFILAVGRAPIAAAITSAAATGFTVGAQGSFTVTSTGSPTPRITHTGALPSGVTLTDNGNGTATLAGTPAVGSATSYPITVIATSGATPPTTQAFTLTVVPALTAPQFTSSASTAFAVRTADSFAVTTTGTPAATLTATSRPALPAGITFTDRGHGEATLAGTAPPGSQGGYTLTVTATNPTGTASQTLLLTVDSGLAITSPATGTATSGRPFHFTVTTTGTPAAALTRAGALPPGVTFTGRGNGTATLTGTPTAAAAGPYPMTFTAHNATGTTSQAFTLIVAHAPAFTGAAALTETAGTAFTVTVGALGYPTPAFTATGLPSGVALSDNGNGTALLSGGTAVVAGTYHPVVTATNAGGSAAEPILLTVTAPRSTASAPTFTSAAAATATAGTSFTFLVTTTTTTRVAPAPRRGGPAAVPTRPVALIRLTRRGALPAGLSFLDHGDGTATLAGVPAPGSGGSYPLTFTATGRGGTSTQAFVLTVRAGPRINTAATATATVGSPDSFLVRATGSPAPTLTEGGVLPAGLTWMDHGDGTASLTGTPGVDRGGVYHLSLTATNPFGTATQAFTLTVTQAPAITSAPTATAARGRPFQYTVTTTGFPAARLTHSCIAARLWLVGHRDGTATLVGRPVRPGRYRFTITARNAAGSATQVFVLTVR